MRSQKHLRDELRFVTECNTFFDVLQQGAVAQLRRGDELAARQAVESDLIQREYLPLVPAPLRAHPLVRGGASGRLLVVMTSDEGLVGPLHSLVMREAQERAEADTRWILVGQRGRRLLTAAASALDVMPMPTEEHADDTLRRLGRVIVSRVLREQLRDAWLVSARYVSASRQEVACRQLLPLPLPPSASPPSADDVIAEPSGERVLEALSQSWVESVCVDAFWSARRAEFAAKAMHAEASRQELAKRNRLVRHEFFKAQHERVDVLVRETCVVQRQASRRSADAGAAR